ncbi:MAG: arsenate reductase ArsC [Gammaproteobacteria bacterium]
MKRLLFLCIENSCRSQMAEAFARIHGKTLVQAYSSGSAPSGGVNPQAINAMQGLGYDLSTHHSKQLTDLPDIEFDAVVTMGCGDACPNIRAKKRIEWDIPDPESLNSQNFNAIRDLIEENVKQLIIDIQRD